MSLHEAAFAASAPRRGWRRTMGAAARKHRGFQVALTGARQRPHRVGPGGAAAANGELVPTSPTRDRRATAVTPAAGKDTLWN